MTTTWTKLANIAGPTLLTNGEFSGNANGWTLNSGWTYGSNNVHTDGSTTDLSQTFTTVQGTNYYVSFEVSGSNNGGSLFLLGGAVSFTASIPNGTYSVVLTAGASGSAGFAIRPVDLGNGAFSGTIDAVFLGLSEFQTPWSKIPKAISASTTINIIPGNPIGLLLALTYADASSYSNDTWTKITKSSGTSWTPIPKAT